MILSLLIALQVTVLLFQYHATLRRNARALQQELVTAPNGRGTVQCRERERTLSLCPQCAATLFAYG